MSNSADQRSTSNDGDVVVDGCDSPIDDGYGYEEKKHEHSPDRAHGVPVGKDQHDEDSTTNGSRHIAANQHPAMDEQNRLDLAWKRSEKEYTVQNSMDNPHRSQENVSPLMAQPSDDDTVQMSNTSNHLLSELVSFQPKSYTSSHNTTDIASTSISIIKQPNCNSNNNITMPKRSLIQRYRNFLQKHEPSLDLLQHIMERFIFYRYLFKHDHRGIHIEMYYAAWNLVRWVNDVVLVGWGEGMGVTVGRREEWFSGVGMKGKAVTIQDWLLARMNTIVPLLRAMLTATTCLYPAIEAWSRRSVHTHPTNYGALISPNNNQQHQDEWYVTTTDPSPHRRRGEKESRQRSAAEISYRLERVRFLGRLALLSISWWASYRQRCLRDSEEENGVSNGKENIAVPSILRRGGELDPYEELVPLKTAEDEAAVVQYVGKRTGRRSVSSASVPSSYRSPPPSSSTSLGSTFIKWLTSLVSSKNNVLYIYATGEILHILRPLYWSHAECNHWNGRSISMKNKQSTRSESSYSMGLWRAWLLSLIMDHVSDKLSQLAIKDTTQSTNVTSQRRGPLFSRTPRRNTITVSSSSPSAEQAKQEELEWRRSRHGLYLLRSPMYNTFTQPVVTLIGKIVTMIPSMGVGRWAAEYVLDMMRYWNEHRFMLES
eukprot:g5557.t1 g5557   contig2:782132-784099(-)